MISRHQLAYQRIGAGEAIEVAEEPAG